MEKYNDLELAIISCLVQRPELMKKLKIEDKHFQKHQKLWIFLKEFYKKFGTFDFVLMYSVASNKYQMIEYIQRIAELEPAPSLIEKYEDRLIELYEQSEVEKKKKEEIYKLVNKLSINELNLDEFKIKMESLFKE